MWNNPLQTVQTPWGMGNLVPGERNTLTGFVEDAYMNDYAFDSQHHAFQSTGKKERERKRERKNFLVSFSILSFLFLIALGKGVDPNSNNIQITSFESMLNDDKMK